MLGPDLLLGFVIATATFALIPGPAMVYAAAQTLARGRRAGLMAALGLHVGCYAHVIAAAFGLSTVLHLVPNLYVAVKIVGAAYLVWLGIGMLRRAAMAAAAAPDSAPPTASGRMAFAQSVVVEVTNPKVAIFFLAFLPQFVDPAGAVPTWAQFLVLGTIVNLCLSAVDVAVVLAASAVTRGLASGRGVGRVLGCAGGSIMVGLGIKLATERG